MLICTCAEDDDAVFYLSFILDVISSFPVQYIDCIPNVDIGAWKLLRLVRLLKLLRLYRLDEFFKIIHFRFPDWIYMIAVVKLSVTFLLVAHLVASAFFYMAEFWTNKGKL